MGQIQNAISGAVGSVAIGAIAEQKTKGMKKEIADLDEYMALNHEAIEDQQRELFKLEEQLRFSQQKAATAKTSKKTNQKNMKAQNKYKSRIQYIQARGRK